MSPAQVAVVIPARNEESSLPPLLVALRSQSLPPAKIVVCDADSTDRTIEVLDRFEGLTVVKAGPAFPGRARNTGARVAAEPWLAFVDCGCVPARDWLEGLVAAANGADVVYGNYDPQIQSEWDAAQALALLPPKSPVTGCRPPSTASMLIRRDVFARVEGFPEHLRAAEDLRFFETLRQAGARVAWAPTARVFWQLAPGPVAAFRRLRLYSQHHAAAGLTGTWHMRVLAMDAVALGCGLAGLYWPVAWAVLAAAFGARVWRTIARGRGSAPVEARRLSVARVSRVAALILIADLACLLGLVDFFQARFRRTAP